MSQFHVLYKYAWCVVCGLMSETQGDTPAFACVELYFVHISLKLKFSLFLGGYSTKYVNYV